MFQLSLSFSEAMVLKAVLENYLSDLRQEISATDLVEFKEELKERKAVIEKILGAMPVTNV